jgi:hypothetical protein
MRIRPLLRGIASFVPGADRVLPWRGTGGTSFARYGYQVWLKHLSLLWAAGMTEIPDSVAELGPGDSLAIGLCAVLSGVDSYWALDVVPYSSSDRNLKIFDELVQMFQQRAAGAKQGWPPYHQHLDERLFPSHILTDERLDRSLEPRRLDAIRAALSGKPSANVPVRITYVVPWTDVNLVRTESIQLILSHSVLEHVVDLPLVYRAMAGWLVPGGLMSHQIDFGCHGLSKEWNGYRACSETHWRLVLGRRPYLINREPYSTHRRLIEANHFELITELKASRCDGIERARLAPRWKHLDDEDLNCSGVFLQARKPLRQM